MTRRREAYGMAAGFQSPEALLAAVRRTRAAGYEKLDACTPFPIEDLPEALGQSRSRVPLFALVGGVIGAGSAYFLLWYSAVIDYPWNIGSRPLHSWPSFIPITFELGVLGAAMFIFGSVFMLSRLPRLHHPLFDADGFDHATCDRFFLCIEADDPRYDSAATRQFLETLDPMSIDEVRW